jgi:RNA polymerase sigma-70 factor (ECF subfamily)
VGWVTVLADRAPCDPALTNECGWELDQSTGQLTGVEESLRSRLRAGEATAFGELFDQHASAVYRHGLRLVADHGLAEDVVSATFLHAWQLRERIEPDGGSLRPWLLGIATNVIRNLGRKRHRDRALLDQLARPHPVPDFADEVAGRLDDQVTLAAVEAALPTLRPEEREVIALCVWSGLDYAEAAEALGIPIGTVRSRLSRARRRLDRAASTIATGPEPNRGRRQLNSGRVPAARPAPGGNP